MVKKKLKADIRRMHFLSLTKLGIKSVERAYIGSCVCRSSMSDLRGGVIQRNPSFFLFLILFRAIVIHWEKMHDAIVTYRANLLKSPSCQKVNGPFLKITFSKD